MKNEIQESIDIFTNCFHSFLGFCAFSCFSTKTFEIKPFNEFNFNKAKKTKEIEIQPNKKQEPSGNRAGWESKQIPLFINGYKNIIPINVFQTCNKPWEKTN